MSEFSEYLKEKFPKHGVKIVIVAVCVLTIIFNWGDIKEITRDIGGIFSSESIFDDGDDTYNVLIYPTNKLSQGNNIDVFFILKERLMRTGERENIKIEVHYVEEDLHIENYIKKDWENLLSLHNAHLVIYGDQLASRFDTETDRIAINFIAKSNVPGLNYRIESQGNELEKYSIDDIQEGKLSVEIESSVFFFLAYAKMEADDNEAALELSEKVISYKELFEMKTLLSLIYWNREDYVNALFYNTEALRISPYSKSGIRDRLVLLVGLDRCSEAIGLFEQIVDNFEDDSALYNSIGNAYWYLGNNQKALDYYNLCISIDKSKRYIYYYNRALAYKSAGKNDEAIEDYTQVIRLLEKDNLDIRRGLYTNRGVAKVSLGKLEEALKDHNLEIQHYPENAVGYYNRSVVYRKMGQREKRLQDLNMAISLDSKFIHAYVGRGYCYMKMKNTEKAFKEYNMAVKIDSINPYSYLHRGVFYQKVGDFDNAIKDLDYSFQLGCEKNKDCDLELFYNARGVVKLCMREPETALEDFLEAIKLGRNDSSIYLNIGTTYALLGDIEKQCEYWTIAADKGSNSAKLSIDRYCK